MVKKYRLKNFHNEEKTGRINFQSQKFSGCNRSSGTPCITALH